MMQSTKDYILFINLQVSNSGRSLDFHGFIIIIDLKATSHFKLALWINIITILAGAANKNMTPIIEV